MAEHRHILVKIAGVQIGFDVDRPPWGWRWWTFAGFPGDPVEPRPYGGSRGVTLAQVRVMGAWRWITAMELDGSAQLWTDHELFPSGQEGAEAFAETWIARHLAQPEFPGWSGGEGAAPSRVSAGHRDALSDPRSSAETADSPADGQAELFHVEQAG